MDNDFFINTVPIKTHDAPLFSKREVFFFPRAKDIHTYMHTYMHPCIHAYVHTRQGAVEQELGWRGRERGPETRYTTRRGARSGPGRGRAIPSLGSAPHSRVPAPLGGTGGINVHVYVSVPGVYVSLSGPPAQSRYSFDQLTIQPSSLSCDCA